MSATKLFAEMPPIEFHVAGKDGQPETLLIPPRAYIFRRDGGCSLGFSAMEVTTDVNGPLWILGMSIFYEYHVGFDLSTSPHSISFTNVSQSDPCIRCDLSYSYVADDSVPQFNHLTRNARV